MSANINQHRACTCTRSMQFKVRLSDHFAVATSSPWRTENWPIQIEASLGNAAG